MLITRPQYPVCAIIECRTGYPPPKDGWRRLGPPIPTTFGNTGISVFYKLNTGIPVLIPVLDSMTLLEQNLNNLPKIGNTGQPNAKKTTYIVL